MMLAVCLVYYGIGLILFSAIGALADHYGREGE